MLLQLINMHYTVDALSGGRPNKAESSIVNSRSPLSRVTSPSTTNGSLAQCAPKMHPPLFLIFYSTTFTILTLILVVLLLITPGDTIYQAYTNRQFYYISVIGGAYLLTLVFAILIYTSRLYTNRTVLAGIPKTWIPVEKGDVGKSVRRIIVEGLERSALVAFDARPRNLRKDRAADVAAGRTTDNAHRTNRKHDGTPLQAPSSIPSWGPIAHAGWSSPSSTDLPNLHYEPVILELPHLIEAKAVSLAPPDPAFFPADVESETNRPVVIPDARVVELLQRPATMGLRDYVSYLASLNLINPPNLGAEFLGLYERARFSGSEFMESEFRRLMAVFAEILRGMKEVDPAVVAELLAKGGDDLTDNSEGPSQSSVMDEEDEVDDKASMLDRVSLPADRSRNGSEGTIRTSRSHLRNREPDASNTFTPPAVMPRTPSASSLKRVKTATSSSASTRSGSSVIRLVEARTSLDLPYTITMTSSGEM